MTDHWGEIRRKIVQMEIALNNLWEECAPTVTDMASQNIGIAINQYDTMRDCMEHIRQHLSKIPNP